MNNHIIEDSFFSCIKRRIDNEPPCHLDFLTSETLYNRCLKKLSLKYRIEKLKRLTLKNKRK